MTQRLLLVAILLVGCGCTQTTPADLVVTNARVLTVDAAFSVAGGVAVRDGRIEAVLAPGADASTFIGPDTRVIDAGGRTVIPGIIDTHVHADHVTALGDLRSETDCVTLMGEQSRAECVSRGLCDGELVRIDGVELRAIYTPGHTDDSYSFVMPDRVFTGDTLLIRGTGRTDFQNGDAAAQYRSLRERLLTLPDETLVYPAHDYKGWTVSTIAEERAHNPRLQVGSEAEYVELMQNLKLPNPKLMDVAVPANLACGR